MISLCQDVSISYEYHVYENKTLKKVIHKRNGSNISQKTFVKASKLTLVSKDIEKAKFKDSVDDNKVPIEEKNLNDPQSKKHRHKRSWSNHVNPGISLGTQTKVEAAQISENQFNSYQRNIALSYQPKKETNKPQVYFNQSSQYLPQQNNNIKPQNYKFYSNPEQIIIFNGILSSGNLRPVRYLQNQKERILKTKPLIQESFKDHQKEISQKSNIKHTRTNSFTTYQTVLKQNLQKIESSTVEDFTSMEKQFVENHQQKYLQLRQNSLNLHFQNPKMLSPLEGQSHRILSNHSFNNFSTLKFDLKNLREDFEDNFKSPSKKQNENIFDAESTISKNLNDENDSESGSIVQQRNFFFQKQQHPVSFFKKSIENLLFFEPGYLSSNNKWILFKNVQDKENKKMYSVKQFSTKNEKEYLNEYQIYLALKAKIYQYSPHQREKNVFLNLFNVLSNNQEKKLYLIKENFQYSLNQFINFMKVQSKNNVNPQKFLEIENAIIKNQIKEIFMFFLDKGIQFFENEELEIQDFVVCMIANNKFTIKFHSLYKLGKSATEKLKFSKFSKLKRDYQQTYQLQESQQALVLNLISIQRKILNKFFCT